MPIPTTEINPFDLADIREKLPALESALKAEQAELEQESERLRLRQQEIKSRTEVVESLRRITAAHDDSREQSGSRLSNAIWSIAASFAEQQSTTKKVVEIVNALDMPVRVDDVLIHMPADANRDTAQWALWKAEQEGKLKRLTKGVYAPLSLEAGEKETGE